MKDALQLAIRYAPRVTDKDSPFYGAYAIPGSNIHPDISKAAWPPATHRLNLRLSTLAQKHGVRHTAVITYVTK